MSLKDIIAGEVDKLHTIECLVEDNVLEDFLTTAMTKAWEGGRQEVLDELREEQKKFTEGFAYRKTKDTPAENLLDDNKGV